MAGDLIRGYDTAAAVSRRAAIALDDLAVTIESPSSMLAAARVTASPPVVVSQSADDDATQEQAQPAPPQDARPPQAGQIEHIRHGLQITEPTMLLRAAAIDDAARDVLAHATASSRNRDSINQPAPRRIRESTGGAARIAAKDPIHAAAVDQRQIASYSGGVPKLRPRRRLTRPAN